MKFGAMRGVAVFLFLGMASHSHAWGFAAHRFVNERAALLVPPPLGAFLAGNKASLREHSVDPDLWRAGGDRSEEPQHFLDLDAFGPDPRTISMSEEEHLKKHGRDAISKGRVPWRAGEEYRALVEAFRKKDYELILQRAAVLGHYVSDAHVPLHSVVNYDGQLSGQEGVHARWESEMFDRFSRQIRRAVRPRFVSSRNPVKDVFGALYESFGAVPSLLAADKACTVGVNVAGTFEDERYDDEFYSCLYEGQDTLIAARATRAIERLAGLWHGAWMEAGSPRLDASYRPKAVRGTVRGVFLSLDGSAHAVIEDAVARGVMPHLKKLREEGTFAEMIPVFPSKTAATHASLFTGVTPEVHGIYGNARPRPQEGGSAWTEMENGYSSTGLRAEPIWVAAARQGLRVVVAGAPQSYPFEPYLSERRFGGNFGRNLVLFDGYQGLSGQDAVVPKIEAKPVSGWVNTGDAPIETAKEFQLKIADATIDGLLLDDPKDPVAGFDTMILAFDKDLGGATSVRLKPVRANPSDPSAFVSLSIKIADRDASLFFRLFDLAPDGSSMVLYRTAPAVFRSSRGAMDRAMFEAAGGFVGNGASFALGRGELGATLDRGGDGEAERRYAETASLVIRQTRRLSAFAMTHAEWDLFISYLPYPDEILHALLGFMDPSVEGHDPALAAKLRPIVDQVLQQCDAYVREMTGGLDPATSVAVVATDHGMQTGWKLLRPNVALAQAGIVTVGDGNLVDAARSLAYYGSGNSGHIYARDGMGAELRARIESALKAAFPADSFTVVERAGNTNPQSLRISPLPGYDFSTDASGPLVSTFRPQGVHGGDAERVRALRGHVAFWGRGVAPDHRVDPIAQTDIASKLSSLLGLLPPSGAIKAPLRQGQ